MQVINIIINIIFPSIPKLMHTIHHVDISFFYFNHTKFLL